MHRFRGVFSGVAGTPWYTNFYTTADTPTAVQDFCDEVAGLYGGYQSRLANGLVLTWDAFAAHIDVGAGDIVGLTPIDPPDPILFSNNLQMLPRASQVCVSTHTGQYAGGREVKGRFNIPGFCEDANNQAGRPEPVTIADAQGVWGALVTADVGWCVYGRKAGVAAEVTSVSVKNDWAVLRSRRD